MDNSLAAGPLGSAGHSDNSCGGHTTSPTDLVRGEKVDARKVTTGDRRAMQWCCEQHQRRSQLHRTRNHKPTPAHCNNF